jgi:hypothetical protein
LAPKRGNVRRHWIAILHQSEIVETPKPFAPLVEILLSRSTRKLKAKFIPPTLNEIQNDYHRGFFPKLQNALSVAATDAVCRADGRWLQKRRAH